MSSAYPMSPARRESAYLNQNGCERLTVAQQRQIRKSKKRADQRSRQSTRARLLRVQKSKVQ